MQQLSQISFSVPAIVAQSLAKRAAPLNIRPAEYARRLFEAAYAARVSAERGTPVDDSALDHQVRQVFLLADCEPEYIADALGLPEARVTRILEGWRTAARELVQPESEHARSGGGAFVAVKAQSRLTNADSVEPSSPVPPPARSPAEDPRGSFGAEEVQVITNLWREGKTTRQIAETVERTIKQIEKFAASNRDICPARRRRGE